ncbi:class 3-domain-containing protein [Syncephalastrum racemosum]|uniref:Class 3-domain-containing protein n=1 Tax=Syncephalastrum racemosum TaxID=13706 RepID=A0A1X2GZI1_SYNRA|nr:class 3-domain-containing protein [Syncephalastrum racemosum]
MSQGLMLLYIAVSFVLASIPALAGLFARWKLYLKLGAFLYAISASVWFLAILLFVTFKIVQHSTPFLLRILGRLNRVLSPVVSRISQTKVVGPCIAAVVRANFFVWFMVLLVSDQLMRALLSRLIGRHTSQANYSIVNTVDPTFSLIPAPDQEDQHKKVPFNYSSRIAYTLAVASKLAYEDVDIVQHELRKDGFDVDHSFLPIAYKNVCAYIIERQDEIFLIFRGTNPLNIQNFVTDFSIDMKNIQSNTGKPMGQVHQGFWDAMGHHDAHQPLDHQRSHSTLHIELNAASLYRTVSSTVEAAMKIGQFAVAQLLSHVADPIDQSWAGYDTDVRSHSLFSQAENWILSLADHHHHQQQTQKTADGISRRKKRLYVAGHSLGGALGTIFVAKMLQTDSPLLQYFGGLYTYGQPKIGDGEFTRCFPTEISHQMYHHVYNNDIVARVPPSWFHQYETPPGTLVYINASHGITLYPPHPKTHEPVPVRTISYLHLSGLLNRHVIRRLPNESWLRIIFRLVFPFFLNDHFPTDYCNSLRFGQVLSAVRLDEGMAGGGADEESAIGLATAWSGRNATLVQRS